MSKRIKQLGRTVTYRLAAGNSARAAAEHRATEAGRVREERTVTELLLNHRLALTAARAFYAVLGMRSGYLRDAFALPSRHSLAVLALFF